MFFGECKTHTWTQHDATPSGQNFFELCILFFIDGMVPTSKDEFEKLSKAICEKVQLYNQSSHYNDFIEGLIKDLALDLPAPTLKKVKIHVETLHSTKVRESNAKTKGKGKKGSTVKMDLTKDLFGGGADGDGYNEMDDFM